MSFNSTKDLCSLSEKIQNNGPIIVSMNVTTQCILHPIEIATQPGSYRSKTLGLHNKYRWHLLPKFPSTDNFDQPSNYLLLSNVPFLHLSLDEMIRRQYRDKDFISYDNISNDASTQCSSHLLYGLFLYLSQEWHMPLPLLMCNYELMILAMSHLSMDDFVCKVPSINWTLNEWKMALEFYLQMDVDCFYLKTCSFRHSTPRKINFETSVFNEGMFCTEQPEARYSMKRCSYRKCLCCRSPNRTDEPNSRVKFIDHQIHTFVNEYQAILNCDVTYTSENIIYALTCPCQQFDYIGRTEDSFCKCLYDHRSECSRIIREFLLGPFIVTRFHSSLFQTERILANNDMNLYRHLVSCPTALQLFLNYYSHYWCLIPMSNVDADRDDRNYGIQHSESMVSLENSPEETIQSGDESINEIRDHDTIVWCQDHLPSPPISYRFSKRQRAEQYSFFQTKLDGCPLSRQFDIYNASIVIALPDDSSCELLHFVQALLVTHAETKLNRTKPLFPPHFERSWNWCHNLRRPIQ